MIATASGDLGFSERTSNDHCTPQSVLDAVRRVGPIGLDPCSNPWSAVGARIELSRHAGDDGLATDWRELTAADEIVFVNPPYGRGHIIQWVTKAAKTHGRQIVMLVPADTSTRAFRLGWDTAQACCLWSRRIAFVGSEQGAKFGSVLWYWGPRPHVFCDAMRGHGIVQVLGGQ